MNSPTNSPTRASELGVSSEASFRYRRDSASSGKGPDPKGAQSSRRISKVTAEQSMRDIGREGWSRPRLLVGDVVDSTLFSVFIGSIIAFNMYTVIVETDSRSQGSEAPDFVKVASVIMLAIYSVESALRIYVFRGGFFSDTWNVFDLLIVSTDIFGNLLELAVGDVPTFAIFRLFRVVRVVRLFRSLKNFRELFMMLHGLVAALKAIFWATVMVLLVFLFWSLIGVEIIHPLVLELEKADKFITCTRCPRAFQSVWEANLTLIMTVLCGDSWGAMAVPLGEAYPLSMVFFLLSFVSVHFGIMNLIVAVIVDRAHEAREEDSLQMVIDKERNLASAKRNLGRVFLRLDTDRSGTVTCQELMEGIHNEPEFANVLRLMDVSQDDLALLFKVLDKDGSGELNYNEFSEQLYKMKTNDTRTMLIFMRHQVSFVYDLLQDMYDLVADLTEGKVKGAENKSDVLAGFYRDRAENTPNDGELQHVCDEMRDEGERMTPPKPAAVTFENPILLADEQIQDSNPMGRQTKDSMVDLQVKAVDARVQGDAESCPNNVNAELAEDIVRRLQDVWLAQMRDAVHQTVRDLQQSHNVLWEERFRIGVDIGIQQLAALPEPAMQRRGFVRPDPSALALAVARGDCPRALPSALSKASYVNSTSVPVRPQDLPASLAKLPEPSVRREHSLPILDNDAKFEATIAMVVDAGSGRSPNRRSEESEAGEVKTAIDTTEGAVILDRP